MRLPSVSLTFAVGVLLALGLAPAEARGAVSEPVLATNCMDLAEPKTAEDVVPPLAARPHPVPTPLDARALVLLHELGHLVPGRGGGWLLPNDGDDAVTSAYNTRLIEIRCAAQLNALRD